MMMSLNNNDVTCLLMCGCLIFIFPTGSYGVCETEFSYILIRKSLVSTFVF